MNHSLIKEVDDHKRTEMELVRRTKSLEKEIEERKQMQQEIERVHRMLVDTSRQAGMAEVATSVLHNVGNVLNSVNISATVAADTIRRSCASDVTRIAALLQEHREDLPNFLTSARGSQLPDFLTSLGRHLDDEQGKVLGELQSLGTHIDHIKEIVEMQQTYARRAGFSEELSAESLVEDSPPAQRRGVDRHAVRVVREYQDAPLIEVDKHKVSPDSGQPGKQCQIRLCRVRADGQLHVHTGHQG